MIDLQFFREDDQILVEATFQRASKHGRAGVRIGVDGELFYIDPAAIKEVTKTVIKRNDVVFHVSYPSCPATVLSFVECDGETFAVIKFANQSRPQAVNPIYLNRATQIDGAA